MLRVMATVKCRKKIMVTAIDKTIVMLAKLLTIRLRIHGKEGLAASRSDGVTARGGFLTSAH